MKKLLSIVLCFILCLSIVGCSSSSSDSNTSSTSSNSTQSDSQSSDSQSKFEEVVLVDNDYASVTLTNKYEDTSMGEFGYEVTVVNKTDDKNLLVAIDSASVDGVMNDPLWAVDITPGKTDYSKVYWYEENEENKNVKSLDDLKNFEGKIIISDYDSYDTYSEDNFKVE